MKTPNQTELHMAVITMILHDGTLALVAPKPTNPRTDHQVFRSNPYGGYEWAHFADVDANSGRARWYGWGSPELPESMLNA
jgi:hypothetical protein|tara:strand:- start:275 stop:517 length:243 start_codon:yes stop_codon:yes gene_type:complete